MYIPEFSLLCTNSAEIAPRLITFGDQTLSKYVTVMSNCNFDCAVIETTLMYIIYCLFARAKHDTKKDPRKVWRSLKERRMMCGTPLTSSNNKYLLDLSLFVRWCRISSRLRKSRISIARFVSQHIQLICCN